jgi:opacity protein-like surface antigen
MKKLTLITMALIFTGMSVSFGQNAEAKPKQAKQDQSELFNNFYISYGLGSIYYFIDDEGMSADNTSGTFLVGYSRSLSKVIAVGFQVSYTNIGRSEQVTSGYNYPNYTYHTNTENNNLWQGLASVRFQYLNRPSLCMYSGIGMGVTMDNYTIDNWDGSTDKGQKLLPAGQLTLLGFRVGRAFGFFGEFGIGTNSIISAGFSYKIGDNL